MGGTSSEIDQWLCDGGMVVTASDRASRAVIAEFNRARRAEGLAAWPAPCVKSWSGFVRESWQTRALDVNDGRLLLNPVQEETLWAEIARASGHASTLLDGPRRRLAALAAQAHELLCTHAPRFLDRKVRYHWPQDAGVFSGWLEDFDRACRAGNLLSPGRIPIELTAWLEETGPAPEREIAEAGQDALRAPLLLAGFDRIQPVQLRFLNAWGEWREAAPGRVAASVRFYQAPDARAEAIACARWCALQLAAKPEARLLVIAQDANARRGQLERAFHDCLEPQADVRGPLFEFSLGVPLGQVAVARAAMLVLRWLGGALAEDEVDWLLASGLTAADARESLELQGYMRELRRRGLERTEWTLAAFLGQSVRKNSLPEQWRQRMGEVRGRLQSAIGRLQTPLDWAADVEQLLQAAQWPGYRPLSSAEYQAQIRWQQAVEMTASLGFDGRRIDWQEFLSALANTLSDTLFAPESHDAPIQIAGPAESAGLTADALWFLGADDDSWPLTGPMHPLLPPEVQREAEMPHATAQLDGELARKITQRLLASAAEVNFSFARQNETAETGPSRLITQVAGAAEPLPPDLVAPAAQAPRTVAVEDSGRIAFRVAKAEGGASLLTAQSQCPFQGFARARLAAEVWNPAEAGLTASQRGQLLHAVLHSVWGGATEGLNSFADLKKLPDVAPFVERHVRKVAREEMPAGARERMPRRYLELEEERLIRLVSEWLRYEAHRVEFEVEGTEIKRTVAVEGLLMNLRMDRIDRLRDGSRLVIDYKSGNVTARSWDLPRPDDVQLPLYAGFALEGKLGGLVFAKVRTGEPEFAGRMRDARDVLRADLSGGRELVKTRLTDDQLEAWRSAIRQLALDFLEGKADVDPREDIKTCERCGLETLCRIRQIEGVELPEKGGESDEAEAGNE
jgi:ATP-dependent helicase/nuclease subunit B